MPPEMIRREVRLGLQTRAPVASTYDPEAHTIQLTAATETPVRMPGWPLGLDSDFWEILDCQPSSVDLTQVAAGNCPLLDSHQRYELADRLGVVTEATLPNRQLVVTVRFGDSDQGQAAEREAAGGAPPKVSSGYRVAQYVLEGEGDLGLPILRAVSWAFREVSFVPIAADLNAGVRAGDGSHPCIINMETRAMPPETAAAAAASADATTAAAAAAAATESARAAVAAAAASTATSAVALTAAATLAALDQARAFGVEDEIRPLITRADQTVDTINAAILERAAARQRLTAPAAGAAARAGDQEGEAQRAGMIDAIASRMTHAAPSENGRRFRGYRLIDLVAVRGGIESRDPYEIYQRAMHTASDFPLLLEAAANKVLLAAYGAATPTYRQFAARRTFQDFKPHKFLRIGEFPDLIALGEGGEVKGGTVAESRETASASTVGRRISLSRAMMINDDLNAFADLTNAAGRAAARGENTAFYALLLSNSGAGPTMADGQPMFSTAHKNIAASGAVPSVTTVGAGRAAMRKQKNIGGSETLNLTASFMLSGPDMETYIEQFLAPVNATQQTNYNPFSGKLQAASDAQISGFPWWLFADPAEAPNFIYGYVQDQEGPMLTQDRPFGVDGVSLQVVHDFGVGAIDSKGAYYNSGAQPS